MKRLINRDLVRGGVRVNNGIRLVVPRGERYMMTGVRLRLLLTQAYQKLVNGLPAEELQKGKR